MEQMAGTHVPPNDTAHPLIIPLQDMQCVENCSDPDVTKHVLYEQPVWQTLQMFRASIHFQYLSSNADRTS